MLLDRRTAASRLLLALALTAIVGACAASALSIEAEPVKVTHRNSGPRYDIDREEEPLDRTKLTPVVEQPATSSEGQAANGGKPQALQENGEAESDSEMPTGHLHIRRIFLVPLMRPSRPDWHQSDNEPAAPRDSTESQESPAASMFVKPFWPFLAPARPTHSHHLFGADEASRSPTGERGDQDKAASAVSGEREGPVGAGRADKAPREPPMGMFDPIQMMMDIIMNQAIGSHLAPMPTPPTDLNKDASSSPDQTTSDERPQSPGTELAAGNKPPVKPTSHNETREEVVEIEGKKYLRKTVINRHVGENIIFMTKRLIFVPLNETESADGEQPTVPTSTERAAKDDVTTTTTTTTTTASPLENRASTEATTTTTTSGPTTVASAASSEQPTSAKPEAAEVTTKKSWADRISGAVDKVSERLEWGALPDESVSSTTAAPTTTVKPSN